MTGFETIGNATVTVLDNDRAVLTTDPWIVGDPYFGSWTAPFEIPPCQLENILTAQYIWLSHGHPDHVHVASLEKLLGKEVLLPDHVGGRMARDLRQLGFKVTILLDRQWINLFSYTRAMCMSAFNQYAVFLG